MQANESSSGVPVPSTKEVGGVYRLRRCFGCPFQAGSGQDDDDDALDGMTIIIVDALSGWASLPEYKRRPESHAKRHQRKTTHIKIQVVSVDSANARRALALTAIGITQYESKLGFLLPGGGASKNPFVVESPRLPSHPSTQF